MVKIIAIGGGEIGRPKEDGSGYYPVETSVIDEKILKLTGKNNPTLLFIPTASNDSAEYYDIVKKHFIKRIARNSAGAGIGKYYLIWKRNMNKD